MPCLSMKVTNEPWLLPGVWGSLSALCLELSSCSVDLFALPCGSTHPQTLSPGQWNLGRLSSPPFPPFFLLFYPHIWLLVHFVFMVNSLIHLWFSLNKFCVALSMLISTRRVESWSMLDWKCGLSSPTIPAFSSYLLLLLVLPPLSPTPFLFLLHRFLLLFLLLWFLRQDLKYPRLILNTQCIWEWSCTSDVPASQPP